MKMALPRGMFRRGNILWARKDVPKDVREIVGQTSLQQTLGTEDLKKARVIFHDVMKRFEARIANARSELAGKPQGFEPITFTLEEMGVSQRDAEAYVRYVANRPENRTAATAQRMERKLLDAGLIKPEVEIVHLDNLFERWITERRPGKNSEVEFKRAKDLFKSLNEDKPIAEYTSADARRFKDAIVVKTAPTGEPLKHATKVKWFSSVKTLFALADRNDLLTSNPFAKIILERPKRVTENKREDWEQDELDKLFSSPVFKNRKRPKGGKGEAAYRPCPFFNLPFRRLNHSKLQSHSLYEYAA